MYFVYKYHDQFQDQKNFNFKCCTFRTNGYQKTLTLNYSKLKDENCQKRNPIKFKKVIFLQAWFRDRRHKLKPED